MAAWNYRHYRRYRRYSFKWKLALGRIMVGFRGAHFQAFTLKLPQDHGRLPDKRISKHSLFSWRRHSQDHGRLTGEHISEHSQKLSRSRSVDWWAHIRAFTKTLKIMVGCPRCCGVWCVAWVHEGVVLCDELCVVLFGVLRGGGVGCCVLCGVWVFYFSFFSQFSSSSFSSLFFLFLFSLLPLSLLSSLLANKHCVKHWSTNVTFNFEAFACDLAHGRCTAVGSLLSSSLLPPPFPSPSNAQKKK